MSEPSREEQVNKVIADYLRAVEAGQTPDRQEFVARHPELAADLEAFFRDQDLFAQRAGDVSVPPAVLRGPSRTDVPEQPTLPPAPAQSAAPAVTLPHPSAPAGLPTLPPNEPSGAKGSLGTVRYFGDYELLEEIARGGMGVVYKARQVSLNRIVALKMILAGQLASEAEVQRFRSEAEAAANLDHPNIVPIYEVGQHEEQHYFSMKMVEGGSLADVVASGQWSVASKEGQRQAARLVAIIARAVHHAHQRGILHRDLKPGNILLAPEPLTPDPRPLTPTPLVTDFGLAKRLEGDANLSQSGAIVGTPAYMAPEQAQGKKGLTTAVDVYSLGAILYELLTGQPPFTGSTPLDVILQVLEKEPTPLRRVQPAIDRDLETICLKCLEKDPMKRYGTAEALAEDLERYGAGEPIKARPVGRFERLTKWMKRRPVVAALGMAVILVTLGGVAGITWAMGVAIEERNDARAQRKTAEDEKKKAEDQRGRAEKAKVVAEDAQQQAEREKTRAERLLVRGERVLYAGQLAQAQLHAQAGNAQAARRLLDAARWDFRSWEHDYLWTLFNPPSLVGHRAGVNSAAFTPDGSQIVSAGSDGTVRLWDVATLQEILLLKAHKGSVTCVAVSPDGAHIASGSWDKTIQLTNLSTGESRTLKGHNQGVASVAFSPDGKRLVSGAGRDAYQWDGFAPGELKIWDTDTATEVATLKGHTSYIACVAFSPDGALIASGSWDKTVRLWDMASGKEILAQRDHSGPLASLAFSPNGKQIVSASRESLKPDRPGEMKVWSVNDGRVTHALKGHASHVAGVAFSPDGGRVVSGSVDQTIKMWDAHSGQELATLHGHVGAVATVAFSIDGSRLVSGSGDKTLRIWHVGGQTPLDISAGAVGPNVSTSANVAVGGHLAFSTDGKRIFGPSKFWDTATGAPTTILKHAHVLALSPDGKAAVSLLGKDSTLTLWDVETGKTLATLKGHRSYIDAVAFTDDGKRLVSGGWGLGIPDFNELKLWDLESGQLLHDLKGHKHGVRSLVFSRDGAHLFSASIDRSIKVWDTKTGRAVQTLEGHGDAVTALALSGDDLLLASGGRDRTIRLWDLAGGKQIGSLLGHTEAIFALAWHPDGTHLASGSADKALKVWHVASGLETLSLRGHNEAVVRVAFSPCGKRLVSGSPDRILLWDASVRADVLRLRKQFGVFALAYSGDGKRLVSVGGEDNSLVFFDSATGQDLLTMRADAHRFALSPDGKRLVSASRNGTLRIWDAEKGQQLLEFPAHKARIDAVAFSPDGKHIASGGHDRALKIWDAATGAEAHSFEGVTQPITSLAYSPNGKQLLAGGEQNVLMLWDTVSGKPLVTFKEDKSGDASFVSGIAFNTTGARVVTTTCHHINTRVPGAPKVWDAATGELLFTLKGHTDQVRCVAFSPDNQRIVSAGSDQTVRVWDAATGRQTLALPVSVDNVDSVAVSPDGQHIACNGPEIWIWPDWRKRERMPK